MLLFPLKLSQPHAPVNDFGHIETIAERRTAPAAPDLSASQQAQEREVVSISMLAHQMRESKGSDLPR